MEKKFSSISITPKASIPGIFSARIGVVFEFNDSGTPFYAHDDVVTVGLIASTDTALGPIGQKIKSDINDFSQFLFGKDAFNKNDFSDFNQNYLVEGAVQVSVFNKSIKDLNDAVSGQPLGASLSGGVGPAGAGISLDAVGTINGVQFTTGFTLGLKSGPEFTYATELFQVSAATFFGSTSGIGSAAHPVPVVGHVHDFFEKLNAAPEKVQNGIDDIINKVLRAAEENRKLEKINHCFAAGTSILTSNGVVVDVKDISISQSVAAFDPIGGCRLAVVTQAHKTPNQQVIDFHGTKVTPGHAFAQPDGTFREIGAVLLADGFVVNEDGETVRARTKEIVSAERFALLQTTIGPSGVPAFEVAEGRSRVGGEPSPYESSRLCQTKLA